MIVALDFDGVVTEDQTMWRRIIHEMKNHGETVCIVTQNYPGERDDIQEFANDVDVPVFFTMNQKKDKWMRSHTGTVPDIIIDDNPGSWVTDSWA